MKPITAPPEWFCEGKRFWLAQAVDDPNPLRRTQIVDGVLLRLWSLCLHGERTYLSIHEVDRYSGMPGFSDALVACGLAVEADSFAIEMLGMPEVLEANRMLRVKVTKAGKARAEQRAKNVSDSPNRQRVAAAAEKREVRG